MGRMKVIKEEDLNIFGYEDPRKETSFLITFIKYRILKISIRFRKNIYIYFSEIIVRYPAFSFIIRNGKTCVGDLM
jgi:hypothetical protein